MRYDTAIKYINDLCKFGINLGLERTKKLLLLAGEPDKKYYIIHVAGTNGKGSTSAMLKEALRNSGLKTGLYTSPHIHSYRERIQINDELISEENFAIRTQKLKLLIEENKTLFNESPTEFEFLTIMAASYFAKENVDVVVFETGLGGRLDSTNALETNLSIITNIGMDHNDILGNTIELIAKEKAGIIRNKSNVVLGIQEYPEARSVIMDKVKEKRAHCIDACKLSIEILPEEEKNQKIYIKDMDIEVSLNLQGDHQVDNMLGVISALEFLKKDLTIDQEKYIEGLSKVNWPGRLETLDFMDRKILIDGAHNPQGARKLRAYLDKKYSQGNIYFLIGILDDKDKKGILDEVYDKATEIFFSKPEGNRTQNWNVLPLEYNLKKNIIFMESTHEALLELVHKAKKDDLILSFGSFYFISKVREIIISSR